MPFLTTALAVGGIAASVGGAAASVVGAKGQAKAAQSAAELQHQDQQDSLAFQKQQYADQQKNEAPFLATGQASAEQLGVDLAPGGSLTKTWDQQFVAPTDVTEQNDPGYKFRLQQGQEALEGSAAARGNLFTGGTAKDLTNYEQGAASNEYSNVYGRAMTQYQMAYNQFQNDQANQFNRLSATAGGGQVAAANLGSSGSAAANNIASINSNAGAQQAQQINNAAAATASGYTGAANAVTGGINNLSSAITLQQLLAQNKSQPAQQVYG